VRHAARSAPPSDARTPPADRSPATTDPWPSTAAPTAAAPPSDVAPYPTSSAHRESSRLTEELRTPLETALSRITRRRTPGASLPSELAVRACRQSCVAEFGSLMSRARPSGAPGGRPARCGRYLRPPSSLAPPASRAGMHQDGSAIRQAGSRASGDELWQGPAPEQFGSRLDVVASVDPDGSELSAIQRWQRRSAARARRAAWVQAEAAAEL
jgi:hypothetical protein